MIQLIKLDTNNDLVYRFREEILTQDHNSHKHFLDYSSKYDSNLEEEVWKFSKTNWDKLFLDALYGIMYNGELASISGARVYGQGKYLRLGMNYYTLKRFRKDVRSTLWTHTIPAATKEFKNLHYSFVTIYPYNEKLESWSQSLIHKQYRQLGDAESIETLQTYSMDDKFITFNNVPQRILYRKENFHAYYDAPYHTSIDNLYKTIADKVDRRKNGYKKLDCQFY
tara:strand:- start:4932 stop:5606 length:675 start_codon:yes stop_codon:yes gene_type:complete